MPSSLHKVTKSITRKRQGKLGKSSSLYALHENSRDAQRIRRAAARDDKVLRLEKGRRERDGKFSFFGSMLAMLQPALFAATNSPTQRMHALVQLFISRHESELSSLTAERRPGRPKSARHLAVEQLVAEENNEYDAGFWTLDMRDEANVKLFEEWKGEWGALGQFKFVRVCRAAQDGEGVRESGFPPTAGV
ncbi:hypothetical protein ANO11243_073570 [Dothideomycetidae sp. 11243]|nr:hypothetical protein ANO11243_073570 [fungal sp. No.11243]